MKIACLIQNLVPYHHVKFEAFAASFDGEVHLVQVTRTDSFKVLEFYPESTTYTLTTLFEDPDFSNIPVGQLCEAIFVLLQRMKPDCLCVSGWGLIIGQVALLAGFELGLPVVLCSDSNEFNEPRRWYKEWIKRQLVSCCSSWLVAGTLAADYIRKLGGGVCATGYDVVDNAHFERVVKRPDGLPKLLDHSAWFLACARFDPVKNLLRLVHAYADYSQHCQQVQGSPCRLVIAGDGDMRSEIEMLIVQNGLQEDVVLLGAVPYDFMPWLYQNCCAFVNVSTSETWGLVVNEAMAAGAPLLLSNRCGCAVDLLQDGCNGYLLDPFDVADISQKMWVIHKMPIGQRQVLGTKSRKIIAEWGPERFSKALQAAIIKAMSSGAARHTFFAKQLLRLLLTRQRWRNV